MSHSHDHHIPKVGKSRGGSRIDTKSKLLITLLFITISLLVITYEQLLLMVFFAIFLLIVYRVNIRGLMQKILVPLPLIVSLGILAYISDLRHNILSFGSEAILYSRLELTGFLVIRSSLIVIVSIAMIESENSFFEVIYVLDDFKVPEILISILLLMYRTALDLFVEAKRMIDVRYSRSAGRRWGVNLYTYRILGYMIGNTVIRAFSKKDLRRDSLYSRNFSGKLYHKSKPFMFEGLLLLWLSTIGGILLLFGVTLDFLPLGNRL